MNFTNTYIRQTLHTDGLHVANSSTTDRTLEKSLLFSEREFTFTFAIRAPVRLSSVCNELRASYL